ncbi:DEAD/DEAH box helicase [Clostridium beijerinckii]|uniref:DEAD/DEAH box helicase n=1 Tax=Clostridium beijerinckii TaxID=1520 RepID=UPI00030490F2|nr:DEAD/DEAH box helicase [Clostridium beijerinckii]
MGNKVFSELGLDESILKAIDAMGFEEPSKIQAEVIPVLLEGHDVIGQAQTGTGKTLAFGAPILSRIGKQDGKVNSIILTPTRELAIQVNDELNRIAKFTKIKLLPVYGGQPIDRQISALRRGIDIVVGTPGRVLDLIRRKVLNLSSIRFLVLDEADEMLNMGFIDDIEEIIKNSNQDRQTMLFSATMPEEIKRLAKRYMKSETKHIAILKNAMTVATVDQYYYEIKNKDRFETLCRILDVDEPTSAIIFCKTKRNVDELVEGLQGRGYTAEGMHGDMNQNQRINTLRKFKEGNLEFLIATDVAARGIDVENVTHVINYDLPQDVESYVHRIGRTGRANRKGVAYTLVTAREYMSLKHIEKVTKSKIRRREIPTVDEIFVSKYKNMFSKIKETLEQDNYKKFIPMATELDEEFNLVEVAAALMDMVYSKEVNYDYTENEIGSKTDYKRLFLNVGRLDKINPRKLVDFFNENAKVKREDVGDIDILEKFSFVNVTEAAAESIMKHCTGKKFAGRKLNVEISTKSKR